MLLRFPTLALVCACKSFIFMICRWLPSGCDDRHDKCIKSRRTASILNVVASQWSLASANSTYGGGLPSTREPAQHPQSFPIAALALPCNWDLSP
jgi:hypothetical protein